MTEIEELKAKIERLEYRNADLADEIDELQNKNDDFSEVVAALRAGRIEDALWEFEKALPENFVGFADTMLRWRMRATA